MRPNVKKKPKGILSPLIHCASERVQEHGAQYSAFAIFGLINYIIPYFMWPQNISGNYDILYFRAIASMLCFLLLTRRNWPQRFRPYLPIYWHATLLFCLPLLATYMLLDNYLSTSWLMNMVLALFLLVLLVDWLSFTAILFFGVLAGWGLYVAINGEIVIDQNPENLYLALYMYVFAVIIGAIFSRNREKRERERLAVMNMMSGTIAHEMRTPLASITLAAQGIQNHFPKLFKGYTLAKNAGLPVDKIEPMHMDALEKAPGRLENITAGAQTVIDMLLMKLKEDPAYTKLGICSMKDCVEEALRLYPLVSDERALIHVDIKKDFNFYGDSTLVNHVLFNLIKNSLHYIKASNSGEIFIRTGHHEGMDCLYFKDTGQGIPLEQLPYIFDRFYTKTKHGAGLGLAFCRLVMRRFKGKIHCDSRFGEFTEFTLSFPVLDI